MATQIAWVIEGMQCKPQEGDLTNVVITAFWRCNGVDDSNPDVKCTVYGSCTFPDPSESFTPYDSLTQDQVLGWCWSNGVDKDGAELYIETQINEEINKPVIDLPLPW